MGIRGISSSATVVQRRATMFQILFVDEDRLEYLRLNRIPPIETRSERIGDKTIFVVQVAEGAAKPYANIQTRETFIRRGGNDVRPDPDTDLRQMFESGGERLPLHWYIR